MKNRRLFCILILVGRRSFVFLYKILFSGAIFFYITLNLVVDSGMKIINNEIRKKSENEMAELLFPKLSSQVHKEQKH